MRQSWAFSNRSSIVFRLIIAAASMLAVQERALPQGPYEFELVNGPFFPPFDVVRSDWSLGGLNSRGDVVFTTHLGHVSDLPAFDSVQDPHVAITPDGSTSPDGIIYGSRTGDVIAGEQLTDVFTFGRDWFNDDGRTLFGGRYGPGDEIAVFTQGQVLVRDGMTIDGEVISLSANHSGEFGQVGFNDAGEFVFVAGIDGGTAIFTTQGMVTADLGGDGTPEIVARTDNDPANINGFVELASPSINNSGEVLFWARRQGDSHAIVSSTRGFLSWTGQTFGEHVVEGIEKFGLSAINDSGYFAFVVRIGGGRGVVESRYEDGITFYCLCVRAIPEEADSFDSETLVDIRPDFCRMNNRHEWVCISTFAGGGSGIIHSGAGPSVWRGIIAKTGDSFGGLDSGLVMDTFNGLGDLNDRGQVVFDVSFFDGRRALVTATPPTQDFVELELGVPIEVVLTPVDRSRLFRLRAPHGKVVLVTLSDVDAADSNVLYLRWGEAPEPGIFDDAADARGEADQQLLIPRTRDEDAWITASGTWFNGAENRVTVRAELYELGVESFSAGYAGQGATSIQAAVRGAGFIQGLQIALKPRGGGERIEGEEVLIVSDNRVEAVFPISGAATGDYDLEVSLEPGLSATLESAFRIVPTHRGPELKVELSGIDTYRYDRFARLTVNYENVGDEEMAAPLLKIVGPVGSQLRLDSESEMHEGELIALAMQPGGIPGVLPPGGSGSLPLVFRSTHCRDCEADFKVFAFEPDESAVEWTQLDTPAGMSVDLWEMVRSQLPGVLGTTWSAFHESLRNISRRISRRGVNSASAREISRFALRRALGRPAGAVLGRVVESFSGRPLSGISVLAISGEAEEVESVAVTDEEGTYALDWLTPGRTYTVALEDGLITSTPTETPEVTVSVGEDIYCYDIEAFRDPNDWVAVGTECEDEELLVGPIVPPEALFGLVTSWSVRHVSSFDPNDKDGPGEFGDEVSRGELLRYTIFFQNSPEASAAAEIVTVTDQLEENLDWKSIRFEEFRVGNLDTNVISLDQSSKDRFSGYTISRSDSYHRRGEFDISSGLESVARVRYLAEMDPESGLVRWTFDASSDDPFAPPGGFLPPDDETGRGEGHVTFTIKAEPGLDEGTEFENDAEIEFDDKANRIRTDLWRNVLRRTGQSFVRGDCDGNGVVGGSPTEAIIGLEYTFRGGPAPPCLAACDAEANGSLGITDYVRILRFAFVGGDPPDAPYPDCAVSALETDLALGCETSFCGP